MSSPVIPYQVFGSEDSIDLDIVFFVDDIKSINESFIYAKRLSVELNSLLTLGKKVNANLATIEDGRVHSVYKGTPDELNNALYLTYDLHHQNFNNQIDGLVARDIELKLIRTMRKTLSFFTRTVHRKPLKKALRSGFKEQLAVLKTIDFVTLKTDDLQIKDLWKVIAFSVAQMNALEKGEEVYTKQSVVRFIPEYQPVIYRSNGNHDEIRRLIIAHLISISERLIMRGMSRDAE